jgi:hypothetical protein
MSGIPPTNLEQQIGDAVTMEIERRLELKSKIDELSTKELERLLSLLGPTSRWLNISLPMAMHAAVFR